MWLPTAEVSLNPAIYRRPNVEIEDRPTEGQYNQLPPLATDLVQRKVAVIVATGSIVAAWN